MSKNGNKNLFIGSKTDVAQAGKSFATAAKSGKTILAKKSTTINREKKGIDSQQISKALAEARDLAGQMKDQGLSGTSSSNTDVRKSGASTGASYINSFDEYDTEKDGPNGP